MAPAGREVVIGRDNRSVALLAQTLKELAHERDRLPRSAIRRPNRRIKGALGPALPPLLLLGTGNPERESPSSAIRIIQLLVLEQVPAPSKLCSVALLLHPIPLHYGLTYVTGYINLCLCDDIQIRSRYT